MSQLQQSATRGLRLTNAMFKYRSQTKREQSVQFHLDKVQNINKNQCMVLKSGEWLLSLEACTWWEAQKKAYPYISVLFISPGAGQHNRLFVKIQQAAHLFLHLSEYMLHFNKTYKQKIHTEKKWESM